MDFAFSIRKTRGITLLNLLVTLAISTLLVGVGIPSLSPVLANHQANNAYQRLFTLIQFARIQSVNFSSQVLICPTINEEECINDWNQALMVFVDRNNDEIKNENELLLQTSPKATSDESINWRVSGRKQNYLRFKPDGSTRNQNGRLTYCLNKGKELYARQIIMYRTGRARKSSEEEAKSRC